MHQITLPLAQNIKLLGCPYPLHLSNSTYSYLFLRCWFGVLSPYLDLLMPSISPLQMPSLYSSLSWTLSVHRTQKLFLSSLFHEHTMKKHLPISLAMLFKLFLLCSRFYTFLRGSSCTSCTYHPVASKFMYLWC